MKQWVTDLQVYDLGIGYQDIVGNIKELHGIDVFTATGHSGIKANNVV